MKQLHQFLGKECESHTEKSYSTLNSPSVQSKKSTPLSELVRIPRNTEKDFGHEVINFPSPRDTSPMNNPAEMKEALFNETRKKIKTLKDKKK